ncbi:MAG: hypothetical protein ACFFCI_01880 [Promethearchaeota archaeon]
MERIVENPQYSIKVRFFDYSIELYDLIYNVKIDSKSLKKNIVKIQKWGYNSFRLLDKKNNVIDWFYVELKTDTYQLDTQAGYVFGIQMDSPDHGYYVGTYEIGEFKFTKGTKLKKIRSYPLEYCSRGCISPSKVFFLGLRENNTGGAPGRHYLAKLNWKKASEHPIKWKRFLPSAIMALYLIEDYLFVGLKDGTLQIWDINKEDCIESFNLFNSSVKTIDVLNEKSIIVGSLSGEIVCLSKKGNILWKNKISQTAISGVSEKDDIIIIIDRNGNFLHIDPETGNILEKEELELKGVYDPSISSNIIFIRDWFVISGDATVWIYWNRNSGLVRYYYSEDPLIRVLVPNPSGFYIGDDDGCVQFWRLDFKIKRFSEETQRKLEREPEFNNFELL